MDPTKEPGILVAQIFLERVAFSHREDFLALPANTPAEVGDVSVNLLVGEAQDGESGLIRVEVKTDPERKPTYNIELAMVALVKRSPGAENMTIHDFLMSGSVVTLLYPFVREAVANLTIRGRFGAVWLNAINPQAVVQKLQAQLQPQPEAEPSVAPKPEPKDSPSVPQPKPHRRRRR
jgi:preprotein translocase subunit SecB